MLSGAGARIAADPEVTRYRNGEPLSRAGAWRNMATFVGHWLLRGCGMGAVARVRQRWVIRRADAWRDRDDAIPQEREASPAATWRGICIASSELRESRATRFRHHVREQNAVFCSHPLCRVNRPASIFPIFNGSIGPMMPALFDNRGNRKYLVARERLSFVYAATKEPEPISTFCLTLAFTGARISEVLALTANRIDVADEAIIFETLKQRKKQVFRAVPVPRSLIPLLTMQGVGKDSRLWSLGRTSAWKAVKSVMRKAGIAESLCKPKALRHAFAVEAGQKGIPLNIVQRWLGRARLETTAIYANALGDEERSLAELTWTKLECAINASR